MSSVQHQGELIRELVTFNQRMHTTVEDLNIRMRRLESANAFSRFQNHIEQPPTSTLGTAFGSRGVTNVRSRSPSPERQMYRVRDSRRSRNNNEFSSGISSTVRKGRPRKNLQIKIPGNIRAPPTSGLPTPLTLSAVRTSSNVSTFNRDSC